MELYDFLPNVPKITFKQSIVRFVEHLPITAAARKPADIWVF